MDSSHSPSRLQSFMSNGLFLGIEGRVASDARGSANQLHRPGILMLSTVGIYREMVSADDA
jgi:hypothetical protein